MYIYIGIYIYIYIYTQSICRASPGIRGRGEGLRRADAEAARSAATVATMLSPALARARPGARERERALFRGNHSSKTTCLTHVFFKS